MEPMATLKGTSDVTSLLPKPSAQEAIVFASQVNGKYSAGDFPGALSAARQAKTWGWISMGLVIMSLVVYIVYFLFALYDAGAEPYGLEDPFYDPSQYEYDPYD